MPRKIFIAEQELLLTGNLAVGIRTLQMLGYVDAGGGQVSQIDDGSLW